MIFISKFGPKEVFAVAVGETGSHEASVIVIKMDYFPTYKSTFTVASTVSGARNARRVVERRIVMGVRWWVIY